MGTAVELSLQSQDILQVWSKIRNLAAGFRAKIPITFINTWVGRRVISMSRYRPPQKPSAKYITDEGEKILKEELHQLWKVERPQVTQSVSEAAALGDRSENAEYI